MFISMSESRPAKFRRSTKRNVIDIKVSPSSPDKVSITLPYEFSQEMERKGQQRIDVLLDTQNRKIKLALCGDTMGWAATGNSRKNFVYTMFDGCLKPLDDIEVSAYRTTKSGLVFDWPASLEQEVSHD